MESGSVIVNFRTMNHRALPKLSNAKLIKQLSLLYDILWLKQCILAAHDLSLCLDAGQMDQNVNLI